MSIGTTRINGNAGPSIALTSFLAGDLSEIRVPAIVNAQGWSYGTGASAVNIVYADTIALTDGSNTTLDLFASGSLLDIFGRALTLGSIKLLYIKNTSTDSTLLVGGGASNDLDIFAATSDIMNISAGGSMIWTCPTAAGIVTTANKNLKLEDDGSGGAGTKNIDVIVMGLD